MEAITIDLDEDGTIRLPESFSGLHRGDRVIVHRDECGVISIRRVPTVSLQEWIERFRTDGPVDLARVFDEGYDAATREVMGLGDE